MRTKQWKLFAVLCALGVLAALAAPAIAQTQEVKEKPRMYTYVALWNLPRSQWGEWAKNEAADESILKSAVANGTLVGYGDDVNLVHQPDQPTHDDWFSSMSMAGLMNVLDQFYKSGSTTSSVLESATKHWDNIYVSRYYNRHAGSWQNIYTEGAMYKLKPDAPDDALDVLAQNAIVPIMEKMLANGTIHEYEIDTEAVHTDSPGTFWIFYLAANADGLDKVTAAIRDAVKGNPLIGPTFGSTIDIKEHRDFLLRSNATYK